MNHELDNLVRVMRQSHGRDLSLYDDSFLAKSLEKRLAATASANTEGYLAKLAQDPAEAETLFSSLHITYSEFFRNSLTFALIEQQILPGLGNGDGGDTQREIRVWSAGCAAGQEAFYVAILLDDLSQSRRKPVPFRIFATDVSEAEVATARAGVYDAASLRNVRLKHLHEYFSPHGEAYRIASRLGDRCDFSIFDLLDEHSACPPTSIYGDFDLVFCSNILFYYHPRTRRSILEKVCRSLAPGGYFVTGEAEAAFVAQWDGLRAIAPPASVFQNIGRRS